MMPRSRYESLRAFHARPSDKTQLAAWHEQHAWATQIIQRWFTRGIQQQFDTKRLEKTYEQFQRAKDPIYHALLQGMGDIPLARAFVSYWKSGQALATSSRFWMEHALVEILVHQALQHHDCNVQLYTNAMLRSGMLTTAKPVRELGMAGVFEHQAPRGVWEVQINTALLDKVDELVAQQERVPLFPSEPVKRKQAVPLFIRVSLLRFLLP